MSAWIYIVIILMSTLVAIVLIVVFHLEFNKKAKLNKEKIFKRLETFIEIDFNNKTITQKGKYIYAKNVRHIVKINLKIEDILKDKKNYFVFNKNLIKLLTLINENASIFRIRNQFKLIDAIPIDFIFKLSPKNKKTKYYYSSILLTDLNTKDKKIIGSSNILESKTTNFLQVTGSIDYGITNDTKLITKLSSMAKKTNKVYGLAKIYVDHSLRKMNISSTGFHLGFMAFSQYLNNWNSGVSIKIKTFLSDWTTIYGVLYIPSSESNKIKYLKEQEEFLRTEFNKFLSMFSFKESDKWLKLNLIYMKDNSPSYIDYKITENNLTLHPSKQQEIFNTKNKNAFEYMNTLMTNTSKEILSSKIKVLNSSSKTETKEFNFLIPDISSYDFNLLIWSTSLVKHKLMSYIFKESIVMAKQNRSKTFVLPISLTLSRHLLEMKYKFPKNLILAFITTDIQGGLFYNQLVNIRNIKNTLNINHGFYIDNSNEITLEVIRALTPNHIFIDKTISLSKKWNFKSEFVYGQSKSLVEKNDNISFNVLV